MAPIVLRLYWTTTSVVQNQFIVARTQVKRKEMPINIGRNEEGEGGGDAHKHKTQ